MERVVVPAPVAQMARFDSLDVIRGIVVLGILLMNVQSFAMPDAAYFNPHVYGDLGGINLFGWGLAHWLVSEKFNALFALLFGAGVAIFMQGSGAGEKPLLLHYRRMFWLFLFGLLHFYLLWWGDVLMLYAIGGCLVVLFRHCSPRLLMVASIFFLTLGAFDEVGIFERIVLGDEAFSDFSSVWLPPAAELRDEVAVFQSTWWDQIAARHEVMEGYFIYGLLTPMLILVMEARFIGLMLAGLLLCRSGHLLAQRPLRDYRLLALLMLPGSALTLMDIAINIRSGFSAEYNFFWGRLINYLAALLMAFGYVGLFCLLTLSRRWPALRRRLQATGRMAFSNYISQSVMCTLIFYSFGLGLFGRVERVWEFAIALAIIGLQLWWSPLLLHYCRFGPLEWLWRSLTYGRWQPLLQNRPASVRVAE